MGLKTIGPASLILIGLSKAKYWIALPKFED